MTRVLSRFDMAISRSRGATRRPRIGTASKSEDQKRTQQDAHRHHQERDGIEPLKCEPTEHCEPPFACLGHTVVDRQRGTTDKTPAAKFRSTACQSGNSCDGKNTHY